MYLTKTSLLSLLWSVPPNKEEKRHVRSPCPAPGSTGDFLGCTVTRSSVECGQLFAGGPGRGTGATWPGLACVGPHRAAVPACRPPWPGRNPVHLAGEHTGWRCPPPLARSRHSLPPITPAHSLPGPFREFRESTEASLSLGHQATWGGLTLGAARTGPGPAPALE